MISFLLPKFADANNLGWTLSTTLRVAYDDIISLTGSPAVRYRDGSTDWSMFFGLNASGDTMVQLQTDGVWSTHTIGGHSTYNTFSLKYDPVLASADLFVNGIEVISDYGGKAGSSTAQVTFGANRSGDKAQGNFNSVSFLTDGGAVPEPTSLAIWGMSVATLVVFGLRRRKKQRGHSSVNESAL